MVPRRDSVWLVCYDIMSLKSWWAKNLPFLMNLQRRKLMGIESQCMALAAEDNEGNVVLIGPEKDITVGSKVG